MRGTDVCHLVDFVFCGTTNCSSPSIISG
jgi:hypothetical protein